MHQTWSFDAEADAILHPTGPKPSPRRFRKLLRREEETLESLLPPPASKEAPEDQTGRDTHGRFAKGNRGGTGNPFARQMAGFRKALVNAVTEDDMTEIANALLFKAKRGDLPAIKLLFSYVLGKPTEAPDPDRLELDDFQLLRERLSTLEDDWQDIWKMVPVEAINEAGHRVADLRAENWREEILGTAATEEPPRERVAGNAAPVQSQAEKNAQLAAALAIVRDGDTPPEKVADLEHMLIKAHQHGCLNDMLLALREETEKTLGALNGSSDGIPPSANGGTVASVPSRNGGTVASPPSRNGSNGRVAPSANGLNGRHPPSANGSGGQHMG